MDELNGIDKIALPEIINKRSSTLDIVKSTKKIVIDNHKFHSLMRSIQMNNPRNIKREILKLPSAEINRFGKIHSTNCSKLGSLVSLKTEANNSFVDSYLTGIKLNK